MALGRPSLNLIGTKALCPQYSTMSEIATAVDDPTDPKLATDGYRLDRCLMLEQNRTTPECPRSFITIVGGGGPADTGHRGFPRIWSSLTSLRRLQRRCRLCSRRVRR